MLTISSLLKKYQGKIDFLDLELIVSRAIKKTREFVLTHPEKKVTANQQSAINKMLQRRIRYEPLAYIFGEKEFYRFKFRVDKNVLVPRPETEMIVEKVISSLRSADRNKKIIIADIGTGCGNIIIALAHSIKNGTWNDLSLYGTDISEKALHIAKQNAKFNKVHNEIKFLRGNLLGPIIKKCSIFHIPHSMIITANLPYLSPKIYKSCSRDIKDYEPKSALISQKSGLSHYEKLLKQLQLLVIDHQTSVDCFFEISPEQKTKISKIIKRYFPKAKINFHKDLSGRWRICELEIRNTKL